MVLLLLIFPSIKNAQLYLLVFHCSAAGSQAGATKLVRSHNVDLTTFTRGAFFRGFLKLAG
jgi:hypothetical protein